MATDKTIQNHVTAAAGREKAIDDLLLDIAKTDRAPTLEETILLQEGGIDNRFALEREVSRRKNILNWKSIAGTCSERTELTKQIEKAAADRKKQLPALQRELESTVKRLQAQIDELNAAVEVPSNRLRLMREACEHLRKPHMLPEFVKNGYNMRRSAVLKAFSPQIQARNDLKHLEHKMQLLEWMLKNGPCFMLGHENENAANAASMGQALKLGHVEGMEFVMDPVKTAAKLEEIKAEATKCQQVAESGCAAHNKAIQECESMLDYYVN